MEFILTPQNLKTLQKQQRETYTFENEGLLTSTYKQETCKNFFYSSPESIYGIKQRVKSRFYRTYPGAETIIKIVVFMTIFGVILF